MTTLVKSSNDLRKEQINPLQKFFGAFLRAERRRLGIDSSVAAKALQMAETYYRLMEAGRTPLNQAHVFRLIELLEAHSAARGDLSQILFSRLSLYLVGSNFLSGEMAKTADLADSNIEAFRTLSQFDPDFERLFEETKDYFDKTLSDERQREMLENGIATSIRIFLTTNSYSQKISKSFVTQILPERVMNEMPTMNIEIILNLIAGLHGRPFVHSPHVAAAWEKRGSHSFFSVQGVYEHPGLVISEENLKVFSFPYLSENRFTKLQFIFIDACSSNDQSDLRSNFPDSTMSMIHDASMLKSQFIELVNAGRTLKNEPTLSKREIEKIEFKLIGTETEQDLLEKLNQLRTRNEGPETNGKIHEAYWSFASDSVLGMAQRMPIGFVGGHGNGSADIWNLSLREAIEKEECFNLIWNRITQ